jgi:AraC-like DNA-binding protein
MEAMARQLATSKRTLQRRLEKGMSYQQVLTETREALARHHLNQREGPLLARG